MIYIKDIIIMIHLLLIFLIIIIIIIIIMEIMILHMSIVMDMDPVYGIIRQNMMFGVNGVMDGSMD
ncbi:unnamed protein product [Brugia pahangi]|uniref:Uncharacterized protein n=1 Tax=Brugia pahangi TaxID=6280 RepID=A0A0N4TCP4_BRUPA|nr:unnamed protein product [Brugia pahangi]